MADVGERLPFPFTQREQTLADNPITRDGREIHYTIAGVPFRTMVTAEQPLTVVTAPVQKEQQDVEPEAGENSLAGWWLRNQSSFHEGAGARYTEARGEVKETSRFWESSGVDVWTPGELKLLRRAGTVTDGAVKSLYAIPDAAVNSVLVGRAGNVAKYTNLDTGTATTTLFTKAGTSFDHVIASETDWFASGTSATDVRVFQATLAGGTPIVWSLTGASLTKPTRILWAKHRLWAVNGNKLYVLTAAGGTDAAPTAVVHHYQHPSTGFEYTDLCDVPGGVAFSGTGDGSSGLQRVTLDSSGAVPTVTGAIVTAVLPNDEKVLRVSSLASSMVLMLTNRGVRVAVASQTNGEMVYGPRFMDRTELPASAKPQVVAAGRWWWLVWGDEAKAWRVDSSLEVDSGVFAYAADMESGSTAFHGITVRNERPIVMTSDGNLAYRHATELVASGTLTTGRIRYRTDELKSFQRIVPTVAPLAGTLEVVMVNDADTELSLITYNVQGEINLGDAQVPDERNPMRFMSVKLNLTRSTGLTTGPIIYGVQVKALPASTPMRIYQIPLACYDRELWSVGQEDGYDGFARERYQALKAAEDAGGPVVLRDYTHEPTTAELCVIQELRFIRHTQPDMDNQSASWGGILIVTLKTLN